MDPFTARCRGALHNVIVFLLPWLLLLSWRDIVGAEAPLFNAATTQPTPPSSVPGELQPPLASGVFNSNSRGLSTVTGDGSTPTPSGPDASMSPPRPPPAVSVRDEVRVANMVGGESTRAISGTNAPNMPPNSPPNSFGGAAQQLSTVDTTNPQVISPHMIVDEALPNANANGDALAHATDRLLTNTNAITNNVVNNNNNVVNNNVNNDNVNKNLNNGAGPTTNTDVVNSNAITDGNGDVASGTTSNFGSSNGSSSINRAQPTPIAPSPITNRLQQRSGTAANDNRAMPDLSKLETEGKMKVEASWTPLEAKDDRLCYPAGCEVKYDKASKYPDPPPMPQKTPNDNGLYNFMGFEKKRYAKRKADQMKWESNQEMKWKMAFTKSKIEDAVNTAKRMAEQIQRKVTFMAKNFPIPFDLPGEIPSPKEGTKFTAIENPPPTRGGGGEPGSVLPFHKVNDEGKPAAWEKPNEGHDKAPTPKLNPQNPNDDPQMRTEDEGW